MAGYKINAQKSVEFLYTNNETEEREIKESIPFTIAPKSIRYLGINLTKEVKGLYPKNYRTLLKEIEKEKQSWGHHNAGFQVVLQSCDHQDNVVLAQKQTHRSMEQNREPRNRPSTLWSTNIQQSRKDYPLEKKTISSINGAGKIGQPHAEE